MAKGLLAGSIIGFYSRMQGKGLTYEYLLTWANGQWEAIVSHDDAYKGSLSGRIPEESPMPQSAISMIETSIEGLESMTE
jgi:hypothetical protein